MKRGSPKANIIGGLLLILLDLFAVSRGRLPLKGRLDQGIELAQEPGLFWAYAASLGAIGMAAVLWGLWGLRRQPE